MPVSPLSGVGEIGDGLTLMVTDGVVGEIGSVRKYDPVNPCDIGIVDRPLPGPAMFLGSDVSQAMVADMPEARLSMTGHQRLYRWPDEGVGPVNLAGLPPGVSKPPVEVEVGQTVWPVPAVTGIPVFSVETVKPDVMGKTLDSEAVIPQRGMRRRDFWTVYKTMPWTPTAFISNVLLEGDTRSFTISGIVYDSAGSPLAGVTVRLIMSSMFGAGLRNNPIMAELVTDGSGAYSFGVNPSLGYELHAYHEGTNVGGISVDDLVADVVVNIYCTTPGSAPPTGGAGMSRSRVVSG
jgi:hypothetical protein